MEKLNVLFAAGAISSLTLLGAAGLRKIIRQRTTTALASRSAGRWAVQRRDEPRAVTPQSFMNQRDVHSGWLQEAWPLHQVSIMCWGSPGTLLRDIPDGLRQLSRALRREDGTYTGGRCGGDSVLRWQMTSLITPDGPSFFGPDSFGGLAQPDAYTRVFGPHMPMPDRELVVLLLQGTRHTAPETLPHFIHKAAEQIEKGITLYGVNDGRTGWAFIIHPSKNIHDPRPASAEDDRTIRAQSQRG